MHDSLMIMTGTLRVFDGYDRWEKFGFQEFGSKKELETLKATWERPFDSNKQYIHLAIREATEREKEHYKQQVEAQIRQHEKEYEALLKKKQELAHLIQVNKDKVNQLELLKIPY